MGAPPPLEDCSSLLRAQQNKESPYLFDEKKKETPTVKQPKKKTKKSSSLRAGFLLQSQGKKRGKKSKKKKSKPKKKETLKMKESGSPLVIPEAQQKLSQTAQGKMGQMAQKLHQDKKVWNAMLSDEFGTAINELSTDPQAALEKYKDNPAVLETLSQVVKTMYGQSLPSISKDIHSQLQSMRSAAESTQILESLKLFS